MRLAASPWHAMQVSRAQWTVTAHGVPVWHFPPDKRDLAERFATDPAYQQQLTNKKGV